MEPNTLAKKHFDYTVAMRREFHMYPELPHYEKETSARICRELDAMGIPYEITGDYNVIAKLAFGDGKKLAIRGDIDALPVVELLDVPWKSKTEGVMHACGHDAHAALLLGTAKGLLEMKDQLSGTIYLCFQQAEELGDCADECVSYLQEHGGVDGAVGIHVASGIDAGKMDVAPGPRCSGAELYYIDIKGRGGHGSRPDLTVDPLEIACEIYQRLKTIPILHHSPFQTSIISTCMLTAGVRSNIVGDTAHMEGNLRYYHIGDGEILLKKMDEVIQSVASFYGGEATLTSKTGAKYPVVNDADSVKMAHASAAQAGITITDAEPLAGSDNFAEFLHAFPGCYCNLGSKPTREGASSNHHNACFDIEESALELGVAFFLQYTKNFLDAT